MNDMTGAELVSIAPTDALTVFTTPAAIDPLLEKIRSAIDSFEPDMTTATGRKAIASMAYKVARAKTYLDNEGKKLNDVQKEIPKKIDATRKRIRDTLDAWADEVRRPLTEWEEAEESRIAAHKSKIDEIGQAATVTGLSAAEIAAVLHGVEAFPVDEACEEFAPAYASTKDRTVATLRSALAERQKYESEQAELARLRAAEEERKKQEREAQIAKEAAEQATREAEKRAENEKRAAEEAAKREREAAERRELELKLQAEQAERRAAEAEARAKREAEAKAAAEAAEAKRREEDKAHRSAINREALEALVAGGVRVDIARTVVEMIARKEIPHVRITY